MLKAIGKFIDTTSIQELFSQEEARSDTVVIEVDRYYNSHDLSEFKFVLRGITESGGEAEVYLPMLKLERTIWLSWTITPAFTKEAGKLALDLFAYRYEENADPEEDAPDYLVRYQLPPIHVKGLPDGTHALNEKSYTSFLLQMRSAAEAFLQEIKDTASDIWARISSLQNSIISCTDRIQGHETRISALEQDFVPIRLLTQAEYNALPEPDEGTLYVVQDA